MSDKSPAFQFYARDYLADENVMFMELEEEGAYVRLMAFCWLEGSIPGDIGLLARLCRVGAERMAALWPALEPCFGADPNDPSRLVHPRLEKEREKQADHRERMSEAGKKGAEKRWKKRRKPLKTKVDDSQAIAKPSFENGHPNAIAMAPDSSAVCSLQSATNPPYPPAFEEWWSGYPRKQGKAQAARKWRTNIRKGVTVEEMTDGRDRYVVYLETLSTDPKFVKLPGTFLGPDVWWEEKWDVPTKPHDHPYERLG